MKMTFLILMLCFASFSQGAIVTSFDTQNNCVLYRVTNESQPMKSHETMFDSHEHYGVTLRNMTIDFEKKIVTVETLKRVVFNFDRPLLEQPVFVRVENKNFNWLINQLNRDLFTFDKICITQENELIWASLTKP